MTLEDVAHIDPIKGTGCLYAIFASRWREDAMKIALVTDGRSLSYDALRQQAGVVAELLGKAGVQRGDFVGLLASRSIDAIAGMLGCLQIGAAYVPLDPTHAPEQLKFIAGDVPLAAALLAPAYASMADEILPQGVAVLPLVPPPISHFADLPDLYTTASGEDAAYVMYTSGTTGTPKGVVVPQRAVAAIAHGHPFFGVTPQDTVLHASTIACDGSTFDIWGGLLNGATVAVVESAFPSVDQIAAAMVAHHTTFAVFYAGLNHLLIDHRLDAFQGMRTVCSGGDVMSPDHARRLLAAFPDLRLNNIYGPTETTVVSLGTRVLPQMLGGIAVPIGKPLAREEAFVVDDRLQPVPTGTTGQLVIAGAGVALGYHNRADRSAAAFVADPRPGRQGRVYLTGDLACEQADGSFIFQGRLDRQIKLGGRRIELDGIEQTLRALPSVRDVVVEVLGDAHENRRIAAIFLPEAPTDDTAGFLRKALAEAARTLPEGNLPRVTHVATDWPLTPTGKVDRKALFAQLQTQTPARTAPASDLTEVIAQVWQQVLGGPLPTPAMTFFDAGGTSLQLIDAHARLEARLGKAFDITLMFETPRLGALASRLQALVAIEQPAPHEALDAHGENIDRDIAIIGMAGRFPGAPSVAAFWQQLRAGKTAIRQFSLAEIDVSVPPAVRNAPNYVTARAIVDDVDLFDAKFFGILPKDAERMDPQARIFLEVCTEALDDAAIDPARAPGPVAVFAGSSMSTYLLHNLLPGREALDAFTAGYQITDYATLTGNVTDSLATRIAYKLDLKGPAMTVATACSTSLTGIAQAVQTLRAGQASVALAGGVSITFPQRRGYLAQEGGMASASSLCRPFDADADGTVFGDGAGVVVLKRLADAERDGDRIYAVIRGAGVTNDGAAKMSYTAPSVQGQTAAIEMAHRDAGIAPETISYVECHGTATPLGDPIEIAGLARAFGNLPAQTCAIGSVKGNVGHLDAAAGVVGVIKTALMLYAAELAPTANFRTPNPRIDFATSPFHVVDRLQPWISLGPRRAGVSSFGVGGTNVHLVLQEAPERSAQPDAASVQVLPLSAATPEALAAMTQALADRLEQPNAPSLADVALTLQDGRTTRAFRTTVVAQTAVEAASRLRAAPLPDRATPDQPPRLAFLFPGQGSQYPGMARDLYAAAPEAARVIDEGAEILRPLLDLDIRELICAADPSDQDRARQLAETRLTQPALYLTQIATARLWQARGVRPDLLIGHSVGEFAAATVAGVMTFETALAIISARGRLMQDQPPGAMLSVRCDVDALMPHLAAATAAGLHLDLAARNAPKLQVLAGPTDAIEVFAQTLTAQGIANTRLQTSHAFHSAMMDPVVPALTAMIAARALQSPAIPILSTVTGALLTDVEAQSPAYWAGQARATVRFQAALEAVAAMGPCLFVEVGAGRTLSAFAAQTLTRGRHGGIVQSLPDHTQSGLDAPSTLSAAFAKLWEAGVAIDWSRLPRGGRKTSLPPYPFQRRRHWVDPIAAPSHPLHSSSTLPTKVEMPEVIMSSVPIQTNRLPQLKVDLVTLFSDLSGETLTLAEADAPFLELGFDSLFMGQVAAAIGRNYGVEMTFRSLLSDYPSIDALAAHLDAALPAALPPPTAVQPTPPMPAPTAPNAPSTSDLAAMIQAQMATLQALQQAVAAQGQGPAPVVTTASAPLAITAAPVEAAGMGRAPSVSGAKLDERQLSFVRDLATRYAARHAKSKAYTAKHRAHLADPRTAAGFHPDWKELTFPIVADRSKGSEIVDIDGNAFVDLVNGFGQTAFGHAPEFVSEAIRRQLDKGYAIGPQADRAGPLADRLATTLGHDRVTFCNTGSEAVMAAMRLTRAVTGRDRIVVFSNDYHGQFDEVLVKGKTRGGDPAALPIAPGIPRANLANMTVLAYGDAASLDWIAAHGSEIAAVIVEPVQSRHPEHRPEAFARKLREITAAAGTALVFDEVVTGFRTHMRGMQGVWGIEADLATYGKVVGGGMPIGLLAGRARFMDALDGGQWRYGDASAPEVAPTFFAGTFVRHPLVLAATEAVLDHLEAQGSVLWQDVPARTVALVSRMNAALATRGLPQLVETYNGWFVINVTARDPRATLLFALMRMEGVHVLDGYCGFLTTAHGQAAIDHVARAFETALDALQSVGILAPSETVVVTEAIPEIPLTASQREIWMTHQLGDNAACSFNESVSLYLGGPLQLAALESAFTQLLDRHDALRMVFARSGSHFSIATPTPVALPVLDLIGPDSEPALQDLLSTDATLPIEITTHGPIRATLVRLGPDRHVLVITAHHIACDGWSFNLLIDELAALYAAAATGQAPPLPNAPSFAAFARAEAGASRPSASLDYWRAQYTTVPPLPDLPTDRAHPGIKSYRGATVHASIDADRITAVRKAGAALGCTLFTTLFGSLQITLGRLSGATDVVLGVPTAGQTLLTNTALVGHCVNFLPIRASFDPTRPAADHFRALSKAILTAFDHQDVTFGTLVQELDIQRNLSRMPLTEVQFNLERVADELVAADLTITPVPNAKAAANFDLVFNMIDGRRGLRIEATYNADLFDAETIKRWLGHFTAVLSAIAADPQQAIEALPLHDATALTNLIEAPNQTTAAFDRHAMVQDLVRATAAKYPDSIAVETSDETLTHAALNRASDALAAHIQSVFPTPGTRIAVALPRTAGMLVALLAVLKAGHTYVPLDPRQPEARLRSILETAEVAGLIADNAPFATGLPLTLIKPADATPDATPRPVASDPERAAYIIFTSGSTGTPKGVAIPHRAVVNFLTSMARAPGMGAKDSILSVTTVMFDIAVLELFLPLVTGARVVIASSDEVRDGFALIDRLDRGDITMMQATPTLWDMLLDAGLTLSPNLTMLAGGEPLPADLATRLLSGGGALWNMYGPTETTIWSAIRRITDATITIGAPIANTELHILSDADQPQPIGVAGELNIGGDGLALGYYGREDLTAAAVRDVVLNGRRRRLYRTGDLAKRLPNGEVVVLGRKDTQVKLRGFRIELGEIETQLRAMPGVDKVAVDIRARPSGDKRLVAWIVAAKDVQPDLAAIAANLSRLLPDYMQPQDWMILPALPQTANGKLDRKALPDPDGAVPSSAGPRAVAITTPATPSEQCLHDLWARVLGKPSVDVSVTLHQMGVDSLMIFRLAARMLDEGLNLDARDLLAHPSIRQLATFRDAQSNAAIKARPQLKDYRLGARRAQQRASS